MVAAAVVRKEAKGEPASVVCAERRPLPVEARLRSRLCSRHQERYSQPKAFLNSCMSSRMSLASAWPSESSSASVATSAPPAADLLRRCARRRSLSKASCLAAILWAREAALSGTTTGASRLAGAAAVAREFAAASSPCRCRGLMGVVMGDCRYVTAWYDGYNPSFRVERFAGSSGRGRGPAPPRRLSVDR